MGVLYFFFDVVRTAEYTRAQDKEVTGSIVQKVNSTIHRIVYSQMPEKGIKSNDTRDIKLARDKK